MASPPASWHALLNNPPLREAYQRHLKALDREIGSFLSFALPPLSAPADIDARSDASAAPADADSKGRSDASAAPKNLLADLPFAVKDNIAVKNRPPYLRIENPRRIHRALHRHRGIPPGSRGRPRGGKNQPG